MKTLSTRLYTVFILHSFWAKGVRNDQLTRVTLTQALQGKLGEFDTGVDLPILFF
jgi:hypothetical protein